MNTGTRIALAATTLAVAFALTGYTTTDGVPTPAPTAATSVPSPRPTTAVPSPTAATVAPEPDTALWPTNVPPPKPNYTISPSSYWTICESGYYTKTYLMAGYSVETQTSTAPTSWESYSQVMVNRVLRSAGITNNNPWPETILTVAPTGGYTVGQIDGVYVTSRAYANGFWTGWSQDYIGYRGTGC